MCTWQASELRVGLRATVHSQAFSVPVHEGIEVNGSRTALVLSSLPLNVPNAYVRQLPFNPGELWSLHQYYFSPAPEPPVTPVEGGDGTSSPSDAHKASRAGAVGKAGVAPVGKDRGGYVSSGWSEVIPAASPRKAVERDVGTHVDGPGGPCQVRRWLVLLALGSVFRVCSGSSLCADIPWCKPCCSS